MKSKYNLQKVLLLLSFVMSTFALNAQASADNGKTLFRNYCAQCHDKTMKKDLTGPALSGFQDRWADYPEEDLYSWIRNSQSLIASGHPRANELWGQWGTIMTAFPNLTDEEIASMLLYIQGVSDGTYGAAAAGAVVAATEEDTESNFTFWIYIGILFLLAMLALVLARVIGNLNALAIKQEDPNAEVEKRSLTDILTSKGVIGFAIFAFILLAGYTTVNRATNLGRQQGYAPEQPIKFSHEIHSGINGIDCNYCHDGARRSKHAVIPAMNTCMNCHEAIKYGSLDGTAELSKIFVASGFNPSTGAYIENYDQMSEDSIEIIFKDWMKKANIENNDKYEGPNTELDMIVEEQWDDLEESLTNENKSSVKGAVEWVRIHNLPDHVYFNHSQHVAVGEIECQTCHGTVEEMPVVEQMSPLSMGWCINCHRQTDVKFSDNPYYDAYEEYHKELKDGDRTNVKVEEIGGLECQKCHY